MIRKFDHVGCLCLRKKANDFANSYSPGKICHWEKIKYTRIHILNGFSRPYKETSLPDVCSIKLKYESMNTYWGSQGGWGKKGYPKVVKERGPTRNGDQSKEKRQAQCGNKSFCSEVYANSRKIMSSPLKLFPAALRTVLEVKIPV